MNKASSSVVPVYLIKEEKPQYPQGWVCPKCGADMSPTQRFCVNCTPTAYTQITLKGE